MRRLTENGAKGLVEDLASLAVGELHDLSRHMIMAVLDVVIKMAPAQFDLPSRLYDWFSDFRGNQFS